MSVVAPGTVLTFIITLVDRETFAALPGRTVELRQYDPAIGDYRPVESGTTGPDGRISFSRKMPDVEGTYRFIAYWPGDESYKGDRSPPVRIEVRRI